MSPSQDPIYGAPLQDKVQWVWVPVPIKVMSATPALSLTPFLPTSLDPNHGAPPISPSSATWLQVPEWDLGTTRDFTLGFHEDSTAGETFPGLDLPLRPFENTASGRSFLPIAPLEPMGLEQYVDILPPPMIPPFPDPWVHLTATLGQDTDSPSTLTPADTPPAQLYITEPHPQLLPSPELSCFGILPQPVDLLEQHTPQSQAHNNQRLASSRFRCPECPKVCPNQRTLDRHMWSKHAEYAGRNGVKSPKGKCSRCDYFGRVDNVQRHERTIHGMRGPFTGGREMAQVKEKE